MEFDFLRILFAFLGGYFLCLSGSLSQLTTNNQLASPSTLGMDGIGVFCVLLATLLVTVNSLPLSPEFLSVAIFAVLAILIFFKINLTKKSKKIFDYSGNMKRIILLGLTFNLFVGAVFSMIQFAFMALNLDFPNGLWFGSFKFVSHEWLFGFIPLFLGAIFWVHYLSHDLQLLNLGRAFALGLNIDVNRLEKHALFLSLVLTVSIISFFGVFSFLGLILPHILRSFSYFEKDVKAELVVGPIVAGVALCFIDWLCFNLTYQGAELPVGMVSGILGSFFLIYLVLKSKI